jgi:NADH-quinone oxidoreductase subunit N
MSLISVDDLASILPALALMVGALAAVGVDVARRKDRARTAAELISYLALGVAIAFVIWRLLPEAGGARRAALRGFGGAVQLDDLAAFLSLGILAATGLTVVLSSDFLRDKGLPQGEYHGLLLLGAAGMLVLVESLDLVAFFVALEILSLAVYVLSGLFRREARSNEASVKYLLMGAFATGFFLYGVALLYGATGQLNIESIGVELSRKGTSGFTIATLGLALVVIGMSFKVGAVPFHMWVPDVYEGAPTSVTAFMAVAVKAAGFGAFIRILLTVGMGGAKGVGEVLLALAVLTMVVGNLLAVRQRSVKRMLAYSSIAHSGYLLLALATLRHGPAARDAAEAAVFYLFSYVFMTLGAFAFGIHAGRGGKDAEQLEDFAGLAKRRPWSAAAMTVFMASLAGLPPAAGFFGKFLIFKAAVAAGDSVPVIVGVLASAVSVYYYLRVVVVMYMHPEPENAGELAETPNVAWVVFAAAAFTLALGLVPASFLGFSRSAIALLP